MAVNNNKQNLWLEHLVGGLTRKVRFPGREHLLRKFFAPQKYCQRKLADFWFDKYDFNLKMLCNLGSYIEWSIFFKGYYQPDLSAVIKKLTEPGMVCFDVGANVGAFTLLLSNNLPGEWNGLCL